MPVVHTYVINELGETETKEITPIKAIRKKCLDCSAYNNNEIRNCPIKDCAIYPFRLGKNPGITRKYSKEQKNEMRERIKITLSKKNSTEE